MTIKKRLLSALLALSMIFPAAGCARQNVSGNDRLPANAEITLAQSVLTPDAAAAEAVSFPEVSKPVTITLVHGESGDAERALAALTDTFNGTNGQDITVMLVKDEAGKTPDEPEDAGDPEEPYADVTEGEGVTEASVPSGKPVQGDGDMILLDSAVFTGNARGLMMPVALPEGYIDNEADLFAPLREQASPDGTLLAVPLDATCDVFYYNKSLFDDLSLTPPRTWEELVRCGETLMEERDMPLLCTDHPRALLELFLRQSGTGFLDGGTVLFNNSEGRKTMELVLPMLEKDYLVFCRDGRTGAEALLEKRAAAYIGSNTDLPVLKDADFEVSASAVFGGNEQAVPVRARMLAVFTDDTDRQAACRAFINYLTGTDVNAKWAVASGLLPVRMSAFTAQPFHAYTEYDDAARAAFAEAQAFYPPADCPAYVDDLIRTLLEDYAARGVMSGEACRALEEEIKSVMSAE